MSHIELKLVADTAADLSGLIAGLQAQMGAASAPLVAAATAAPAEAPKTPTKGKAEKAATDAPAAAGTGSRTATEGAAQTSTETKTEVAPASSDKEPATEVTYAEVQAATTALAAKKGRDAAVGCLAEFDVTNGKDLKPEQWGPYIARAQQIAEG